MAYAEFLHPQDVSCLALLGGIMSLGGGVAVNILKSRGFAESAPATTSQKALAKDDPVQYRACALTALSEAFKEAVHQLVGVGHVLAGILTSGCPEVAALFAQKGVSLDDALSDLRRNM